MQNQDCAPDPKAPAPPPPEAVTPPPEDRPFWQLFLFLLGCCVLLALALWPWKIRSLSVIWAPATHQYLGTVQKVTFAGSWGIGTQIETETRTFFLRGVAPFQRGTPLELRSDFFSNYVCEVGSDSCNGLVTTPAVITAPPKPGC